MKAEKNARMEASNARKSEMQELEIQRKKYEKPSDLEQVSPCACVIAVWSDQSCMCGAVYTPVHISNDFSLYETDGAQ